jgi:hypothetical protein
MRRPESRDGCGTGAFVLHRLRLGDIELLDPEGPERYLLVTKVDDDSLSDRRVAFYRTEAEARDAITSVPPGWWPDCLIDLDAPVAVAVRDAAAGDGSLGDPYAFDAEHVIFA